MPKATAKRKRKKDIGIKSLLPLYKITQRITSKEKLPVLLDIILQTAMEEFHAHRVSFFLKDAENGHLYLAAGKGLPQEVLQRKPPASAHSITTYVAKKNKPLLINGALKETHPFQFQTLRGFE